MDLAGSERLKESGSTGQRLEETKSINGSLSALSKVIMALASNKVIFWLQASDFAVLFHFNSLPLKNIEYEVSKFRVWLKSLRHNSEQSCKIYWQQVICHFYFIATYY